VPLLRVGTGSRRFVGGGNVPCALFQLTAAQPVMGSVCYFL